MTILRREARHAVRVDAGTANKFNASHATATGKAILAWLPRQEAERILLERGMQAFTPKTVTSEEILFEELRHVRRLGFSRSPRRRRGVDQRLDADIPRECSTSR